MDPEKIAFTLRTLRRKAGETQEEAANAVNISPAAWAMYESGTRIPRDDVKIKIADHFHMPVGSIFYGENTRLE